MCLILTMTSCSINILKTRKCNRKLERVVRKCPELKRDTMIVLKVDTVIPEARIDTVTRLSSDTVEIVKDRLTVRYVRMPGDSIYIEGKCDTVKVEVIKEVPVEVIRSVPCKGVPWWVYAAGGFLVLVVLGLLFRR